MLSFCYLTLNKFSDRQTEFDRAFFIRREGLFILLSFAVFCTDSKVMTMIKFMGHLCFTG